MRVQQDIGCCACRRAGTAELVVAVLAACLMQSACAQTFEWTGAASLNWNVAQNWAPGQVPGIQVPGADAVVASAAGLVTASAGGPITLGTLEASTAVRFSGIGLVLGSGQTTDLQFTGGSTLTLGDTLVLSGTTQFGNATLDGAPLCEVKNLGSAAILPASTLTLRSTFHNAGAFTMWSPIALQAGAVFINAGSFDAAGAGSLTISGTDPAVFANNGSLTRSATGPLTFSARYSAGSGAEVACTAGEVRFQAASEHAGTMTLANDASIKFQASALASADVIGDLTLQGRGTVSIGGPFHVLSGSTLSSQLAAESAQGLLLQSSSDIVVDGTIANSGLMTWDYQVLKGSGQLLNTGALHLTGSSRTLNLALNNQSGGTVVQAGPLSIGDAVATNEAGGTWTIASGSISLLNASSQGSLANSGTIVRSGSVNGQYAFISVPLASSNGTIQVAGTGNLSITKNSSFSGGGNAVDTFEGRVLAFSAGTATVAGTLSIVGQGRCTVEAGCTLDCAGGSVVNHTSGLYTNNFFQLNGGTLVCSDGGVLQNLGLMLATGAQIGSAAQPSALLQNEGVLQLVGTNTLRGTISNARGNFIEQTGPMQMLGGSVVNHGTFAMSGSAGISAGIGGGVIRNEIDGHLMLVERGTVATIAAQLDNRGTVEVVEGAMEISNAVQVAGLTLTGGNWIVRSGAVLAFVGAYMDTIGSGARVELHPAAQVVGLDIRALQPGAELQANGDVHIGGPVANQGSVAVIGDGALESDGEVDNGILGEIEERLVLNLIGRAAPNIIAPALSNYGTLLPGGEGAVGPFNLTGDLVQHATGTIAVELAGLTPLDQHDQMAIEGSALLAGTLRLSPISGFALHVGDQFTVLAATGGVSGRFDDVQGPGVFSVDYSRGAVTVTVVSLPIPGDLNGDGIVNGADLGALLAAWGPCAACGADLNGDSEVGGADLGALLSAWSR